MTPSETFWSFFPWGGIWLIKQPSSFSLDMMNIETFHMKQQVKQHNRNSCLLCPVRFLIMRVSSLNHILLSSFYFSYTLKTIKMCSNLDVVIYVQYMFTISPWTWPLFCVSDAASGNVMIRATFISVTFGITGIVAVLTFLWSLM